MVPYIFVIWTRELAAQHLHQWVTSGAPVSIQGGSLKTFLFKTSEAILYMICMKILLLTKGSYEPIIFPPMVYTESLDIEM